MARGLIETAGDLPRMDADNAARPSSGRRMVRAVRSASPTTTLRAVAVLHAAAPLLLLGVHWWFGIDETVYLSQLNRHVPAGLFSAPRARGTTFLAAPVTLLTSSVAAVRIWVAVLSGCALYLAFRPWLRLRPGRTIPLAALLFSTVWTVIYYSFELMPNEWVAFGIVAACGLLLLHVRDGRRRDLIGLAVAMAAVALLRPSDAVYGAVGLAAGAAALSGPLRRRGLAGLAVCVGLAVGCGEWIAEAYTSYGGLAARIAAAQAENGGSGLHFAVGTEMGVLGGPLLCRDGCRPTVSPVYAAWWPVLLVLVLVALFVGWRRRTLSAEAVPVIVGLSMAAQYLFTVPYGAPRFLVPTYALLAIPAASAIQWTVARVRRRHRRTAIRAALGALLVAHVAIQVSVITDNVAPQVRTFSRQVAADVRELHEVGVRPPCLVFGGAGWNQDLAYAAACTNVPRDAASVRARLAAGSRVLWLTPRRPSATYGAHWKAIRLPGATAGQPFSAYVDVRAHRPAMDPRTSEARAES